MITIRIACASLVAVTLICVSAASVRAEQAVTVGGALALLNKPKSVRAAVVLIPGGSGELGIRPDGSFSTLRGNQLVRTRKAYLRYGIATLTIDRGVSAAAAVRYLRQIARRVVVVATSRGTLRVPGALAARPDAIVLTSAFLDDVRASIGSPASLPPTLIVEHRNDGCQFTAPSMVAPFQSWGGAKVRVAWMNGGTSRGVVCGAKAHHGFNGIDGAVVATVARFVTRR